jgi:hypothetical protein
MVPSQGEECLPHFRERLEGDDCNRCVHIYVYCFYKLANSSFVVVCVCLEGGGGGGGD